MANFKGIYLTSHQSLKKMLKMLDFVYPDHANINSGNHIRAKASKDILM